MWNISFSGLNQYVPITIYVNAHSILWVVPEIEPKSDQFASSNYVFKNYYSLKPKDNRESIIVGPGAGLIARPSSWIHGR